MLDTKQTRRLVKTLAFGQGISLRNHSWTDAHNTDNSKRNLCYEMNGIKKFTQGDCNFLQFMTGCKNVQLTTSDRGYNYLRLTGVKFN